MIYTFVFDCCRHFHLILHRVSAHLFSSDFKIFAIDGNNNERPVDFQPVIYHGYLAGAHFKIDSGFSLLFNLSYIYLAD